MYRVTVFKRGMKIREARFEHYRAALAYAEYSEKAPECSSLIEYDGYSIPDDEWIYQEVLR